MFISTAKQPTPSAPFSRSKGSVVVPVPAHEMKMARLFADGYTNIMLKFSPLIAVGIIVVAVVMAKSGISDDTVLAVGLWTVGLSIAAALGVFAYGQWMSRLQLSIINTRLVLSVDEAFGVKLEPLRTITIRDTFTSGTNISGEVSLWSIKVGDDFIGARREA
jgi:hypothetical protein